MTDTRKTCTCTGTCNGAAGLGEGWVCALELPATPGSAAAERPESFSTAIATAADMLNKAVVMLDHLSARAMEVDEASDLEGQLAAVTDNQAKGVAELRRYVEGNGFKWQDEMTAVDNVTTALGLMGGQIEAMKSEKNGLLDNAAVTEDAARYAFIRANMVRASDVHMDGTSFYTLRHTRGRHRTFDAAIDAMRFLESQSG